MNVEHMRRFPSFLPTLSRRTLTLFIVVLACLVILFVWG